MDGDTRGSNRIIIEAMIKVLVVVAVDKLTRVVQY